MKVIWAAVSTLLGVGTMYAIGLTAWWNHDMPVYGMPGCARPYTRSELIAEFWPWLIAGLATVLLSLPAILSKRS